MASTSDIKNGMCINFNGQPFQIIEFLHVKPGKGAAFVRTKIKNLETGRVLDNTFPAGAKIETIDVETRQYQFLYNDGSDFHFMNMENYEQLTFARDLINAPDFLVDGMMCFVLFHATENRALAVELPKTVNLKVTYAEPAVKGNTSTNAMKTVTVEGGAQVQVPLFIKTDEEIVINTEDGSYKERAK